MHRRRFLAGAAAAAFAGGLGQNIRMAQAATGRPDYYPADYDTLVEGSKAEGSLLVYSSMSTTMWSGVQQRYKELYPWVAVETLDLDGQVLIERYLAEKGTGSRTADFLMSASVEGWLDLVDRGELLDYRSPELAKLPSWAMPSPGLYAINVDTLLLVWNKAILPAELVPTGFADLAAKAKANPDAFRGKITTYSAEAHTNGFLAHKALADRFGEKAWEWFETIGPLTMPESSAGPMMEKLISGEYAVAYFGGSATTWNAVRDPAVAELIGWSFISDAAPLLMKGAAVPKGSKNVNAAKLWLDVILSHEGQIGMALGGRTAMRPDVTRDDAAGNYTYASIVEAVGEPNTMVIGFDRSYVEGREDFVARWKAAFGR